MLNDFLKHNTKSDRRALIALALLAVLLVVILLVVDIVQTGRLVEIQKESVVKEKTVGGEGKNSGSDAGRVTLRDFDPNTVDSATLVGFGISPWKVKVFINYRNKGKRFSTPESILDTYKWEQSDYELLRPYIKIGEEFRNLGGVRAKNEGSYSGKTDNYDKAHHGGTQSSSGTYREPVGMDSLRKSRGMSPKFKTLTKVDINTADSATLCSIPGVGAYISMAIIRYREKLGGFASVEQTLDIKQVSPELLEWFMVGEQRKVNKININKDSFQKLNSHPYISYEQTRDLLLYRRLYGKINDESHLLEINIFSKEDVERLRPYLEY